MGSSLNLSYAAQIVRERNCDAFLAALFIPAPHREKLLALYALEVELAHVHQAVREEMIGHIRYAWWQESLEMIAAGQPAREHPVLQALPPNLVPPGLRLVETYRAHYPELPPGVDELLEEISLAFIQANCPQAQTGWQKAKTVIDTHRKYFGSRLNSWLHLKLIAAGLF